MELDYLRNYKLLKRDVVPHGCTYLLLLKCLLQQWYFLLALGPFKIIHLLLL
jgi:hypothetical protein